MHVGPVDQGPNKWVLVGEQGNVTEGAIRALLAGGLEPKGYSQMLHLGSQVFEASPHEVEQFRAGSSVFVAKVGTDDARTESLPQLHGVFESRQTLLGPVFFLDRQDREIRGMDGNLDVPLRGQLPERGAPFLFPRKVLDEGKFHRLMTASDQVIEEGCVVVACR